MENIVDATSVFVSRKCPPGSLAMHDRFGIVRVVASSAERRTVEVDHYDDDGQLMVSEETIAVSDLSGLDIERDLKEIRPARITAIKFG